jgi:ATP-dependent Lon protease
MYVPVFLTNQKPVPLQHSVFAITPNYRYRTSIGNDNGNHIEQIVIVYTQTDCDFDKAYEDPEYLLETTYKIGLWCEVIDASESLVTLKARERTYLEQLDIIEGFATTQLDIIWDDPEAEPENLIKTISSTLEHLKNSTSLLNSETLSKMSELDLIAQMDVAFDALTKDNAVRIEYLQAEDLIDQIEMFSKSIALAKRNKLTTKQDKILGTTVEDLKANLKALKIPIESQRNIQREINRLEILSPTSNEYANTLDYLTWVGSLPFGKLINKTLDIKELKVNLNKNHYGLSDVKQDVLEHLALEVHMNTPTGTVLCFAGPAGVGKTTIAREIAAALGRPIVRVALGGISDEAEIRGHRRTYQGSRAGRILTGIRDSGCQNPVILLDEVDKLQARNGDPSAALLELLDPEQNEHFTDKYLEIPFDLSKAMFICTANDLHRISPPLLDRMDVIMFRDYTNTEREIIVKDYMFPKAIKEYKMEGIDLKLDQTWVDKLIENNQLRQINMEIKKALRKKLLSIQTGEEKECFTVKAKKNKTVGFQ